MSSNETEFAYLSTTCGRLIKVDAEDLGRLKTLSWRTYTHPNGRIDVIACIKKDGRKTTVSLGAAVMQTAVLGRVIRINSDPLDFRKANLRLAGYGEVRHSGKKNSNSATSTYKGVSRASRGWRARINAGGKGWHIGYFKTEIEAAEAYNQAALQLYGEKAQLNHVKSTSLPSTDDEIPRSDNNDPKK